MSVEQYGIRQGGLMVAKVDVPETADGDERARAEALHYMAMYGQDGPVALWHRSKHRRWKPLTGNGWMIPTASLASLPTTTETGK